MVEGCLVQTGFDEAGKRVTGCAIRPGRPFRRHPAGPELANHLLPEHRILCNAIQIRAVDIPPSFLIDSIVTRIELKRTAIGDQMRLLPASSESTFVYRNHTVRRNLIQFSGCRQYSGETRVVFDEVK